MVAQRGRDDSRKKMFLKSLFGRQALAPSLEAEEAAWGHLLMTEAWGESQ